MHSEIIHTTIAQAPEATFSLWQAITSAGPIGILTLLILISFSLSSWAIILMKFKTLKKSRQQSEEFLKVFWQSKQFDKVYDESEVFTESSLAQIFRSAYQELLKIKQLNDHKNQDISHDADSIENIKRALRREGSRVYESLEQFVPLLATIGSTGPFIGLFGTVVGIISSFTDIAAQKSASLSTVAPGIAEALVATAMGLVAAIPAVMAYNYFGHQLRREKESMHNFSDDFLNIVKRHFFS